MPPKLNIRKTPEQGKTRVYVSDGSAEVRFTQFNQGIIYHGTQKVIDAVNRHKPTLQTMGLTDSALNVITAVSENERKLDAVNTWDHSFMAFGMFQWTIGAGSHPGELAALLHKIKITDPGAFREYYGQYGLDIELSDDISGYFILDNKKLASPAEKQALRSPQWAFYLWKSGRDRLVQVIQIQHALSRIRTFYGAGNYMTNGYYISELITSEYGISLILDNHVNRPAYLKPCLEKAMRQIKLPDPPRWTSLEELKFIDEYLKVRAVYGKYPMIDADKRAAITKKYLINGTISAERNSFQYDF